ncbi:MAG: hypothetical protein IJ379_13350 [Lachnospiraceae bacterium]|nr:hypothetical protein [Lachnospiraceae bacterium]
MKKYLIIACVALVLFCGSLLGIIKDLYQEKDRLTLNQEALMEEVAFYQTEAGKSAASVQTLELKSAELERYNQDLTKTISDLNIKLKRVEATATTATKTSIEIRTVVKDSIVYVDSSLMKLPAIKWTDPWVDVDGVILPDSTVDLNIQSVDTLYQVIHRVPKKFWFIKYGTKAIRQEIVSSNPHTKIVYSEYIELSKRKK